MWEAILKVLEIVKKDSIKPTCNGGAFGLIGKMESFDFVFILCKERIKIRLKQCI
jgi:hypothetical protein